MKTLNKLWGAGLLALILMLAIPQKSKAQYSDEITFQTFYDELSPYGVWVYDPDYGDVWVPDVQEGFRPYGTNGHWIVTEYGNTWVSDFEWGWAPFHYGRWRFDDYYGWEWIPDYEWGPAWVNWRTGGGYYGWAPLGPGISIDIAFGSGYDIPYSYWNFAPYAYINSPYIYNYYVPRTRVINIFRRTTIINNTYNGNNHRYVFGPRPRDIERYTGKKVTVYNINNSRRPGSVRVQNNTVNIYRPNVQRSPEARPTRVVDARAYRDANPGQRIADQRGTARINHQNATRLADFARTAPADNKIVRENRRPNDNRDNRNNDRRGNNNAIPGTPPGNPNDNRNNERPNIPRTDRQPTPVNRPGQPVMNDQQRQQDEQRRQDQQRRQRPVDQQNPQQMQEQQARQQQEQLRRQQQQNQQDQSRQQQDQQRQQQEQQRRQQDDQQRRQRPPVDQQQQQAAEQARQQQMQQAQEARRQQQDQQRQQQAQQQDQQRQQAQQEARRQQDQQRQQQAQQQQEQQRQARQQQDQQRQEARRQQEEQQRKQQEEQKKTPPPPMR